MSTPQIDTQEAMDRFAEAVQTGHRLFANPETIQQLSEIPEAREFAAKFEPNRHLEPGDLIAVDPAVWAFTDDIPLTATWPGAKP